MNATTVRLMWHTFWSASAGSQMDCVGVHCAKRTTLRRQLRNIMLKMQNQRNHLCLCLC